MSSCVCKRGVFDIDRQSWYGLGRLGDRRTSGCRDLQNDHGERRRPARAYQVSAQCEPSSPVPASQHRTWVKAWVKYVRVHKGSRGGTRGKSIFPHEPSFAKKVLDLCKGQRVENPQWGNRDQRKLQA